MSSVETMDFVAEAEEMVDHAAIAEAEAAVEDVRTRLREWRRRQAEADAALTTARDALPKLLVKAAAGEAVRQADVAKATSAVAEATDFASFAAATCAALEGAVTAAETRLADARAAAWAPVVLRGQRMRITAAKRHDAAMAGATWGLHSTPQDRAAGEQRRDALLAAAQARFDTGTAWIELAVARGGRLPEGAKFLPRWPSSEVAERRHWRLPVDVVEEQETSDAE